ncbi:hypothetical protein [Singulisphaera sp. GP187]|nr:hypothetical protein [Singulisphaera sp. GP187]
MPALEGFDASKFDVATPRSQAAGERKVPLKGGRAAPGPVKAASSH